ncbi:MAG: hypothetical protein KME31_37715 [Tolypothrix carrinoi HA7290-LM1]|nr:hypothetical protein [Tolypothrix carrinoi HA7290-LM1]
MRTQPNKGYSTKAWNPPRNWVSPERIAPRISAQYHFMPYHGCRIVILNADKFEALPAEVRNTVQ